MAKASSRLVLAGFLTSGALLIGVYLVFPLGILQVAGVLPIVAALISFRINRTADRLPWLVLIVGLGLLAIVNARWLLMVDILGEGPSSVNDAAGGALQIAGYSGVLAASIVVVLRHAPQDAGGVIDAALVGAGLAAPAWEFVVRPRMLAVGTSMMTQMTTLFQLLVLLAVIGALLRIWRTAERARPTLGYFFASTAATVGGLVLSVLLTDPRTGWQSPVVTICWLLGYLSLAAAALDPTAARLTEPGSWRPDELSSGRLTKLGAVLLLVPIVGGVPQILGQPPDGLLLVLGPLITVPLVLTRIGQLMAQRSLDQRRLAHQASHDELTGLANRRELFAWAGVAVERLRAGEQHSVAVLYCDLDDFKPINDGFGHDAGDHVLRVVSERLTAGLRPIDLAGRIGGDEFLAICPGVDAAGADALRDRVQKMVSAPISWAGGEVTVGITVGIAVSASSAADIDDLVAAADQDMYARKRRRRALGVVASPSPEPRRHPQ